MNIKLSMEWPRHLKTLVFCLIISWISNSSLAQDLQTDPLQTNPAEQIAQVDEVPLTSQQQLMRSLLSLNETLESRQARISELSQEIETTEDETKHPSLQAEIDTLKQEIIQAGQEIEIVVLGLQAREYSKIGQEQKSDEIFDLGDEVGRIFQPLIVSLERATEPSRRLEELRQLSSQTQRKEEVARSTLKHIAQFKQDDVDYPKSLESRLKNYETLWATRLEESINLGNALNEQLETAEQAKGSTFSEFANNFGDFVLNRGTSLILALGSGIGFLILCQMLRVGMANMYRTKHTGVLSAPIRIIGMLISIIGVIGALVIAITIFNIRHDWLMLAMSLLLALAISWSFVRALPTLLEETRVLLNLGSAREGERTIVNGLPYRIERLSMYSKLVNPALNGGSLIFPVREMVNMHSRPVIANEAWFPTSIGDWIVRNDKHYQIIDQTPEHVIIKKPGGSEDFVPVQDFLGSNFETLSSGYRRTYTIGLSYNHIALANDIIPSELTKAVEKHIIEQLGSESVINVDTLLMELGGSSLDFKVLVDIGPNQGRHWGAVQSYITSAAIEASIENNWEIPFPQLVIHKEG